MGVVRLSQVLGLDAFEMRTFDCTRRVRVREVVARAYRDAGIRCTDRTAPIKINTVVVDGRNATKNQLT